MRLNLQPQVAPRLRVAAHASAAEQPLVALVQLEADALDDDARPELLAGARHHEALVEVTHLPKPRLEHLQAMRDEEHVGCRHRVPVRLEDALLTPALGARGSRQVVRPLPVRQHHSVANGLALALVVKRADEVDPVDNLRARGAAAAAEDGDMSRAALERGAHVLDRKGAHAEDCNALPGALQRVDVAPQTAADGSRGTKYLLSRELQHARPSQAAIGAQHYKGARKREALA